MQREAIERKRKLDELRRMKTNPTSEEIIEHQKKFVDRLGPVISTNNERYDQRRTLYLQKERLERLAKARDLSRQKAAMEMERKKYSSLNAGEVARGNKVAGDEAENRTAHRRIIEKRMNKNSTLPTIETSSMSTGTITNAAKAEVLPSLNEKYSKVLLSKQSRPQPREPPVQPNIRNSVNPSKLHFIDRNGTTNKGKEDEYQSETCEYTQDVNNVDSMDASDFSECITIPDENEEDINERKRLSDMYVHLMRSKINSLKE